eukprot:c11677_g1_i1 orf=293-463(-)
MTIISIRPTFPLQYTCYSVTFANFFALHTFLQFRCPPHIHIFMESSTNHLKYPHTL